MPDSKQDEHFRDLLGRLLDDGPAAEALSAEEMAEFTTPAGNTIIRREASWT